MNTIVHSLVIQGSLTDLDTFKIGERVVFCPTRYLKSDFPKRLEIGIVKKVDKFTNKGVQVVFQYGIQWCNPNNLKPEQ